MSDNKTTDEGAAPSSTLDADLRQQLLADPELILGDRDVMRALIGAHESDIGSNVIDIRGRAMKAMEERLARLEAAHQTVISNAYENQSGQAMVQRAVLALMEPMDFPSFLESLETSVAPILRIETLRLVFEGAQDMPSAMEWLHIVPEGGIEEIIAAGRRSPRGDDIVLRPVTSVTRAIHGTDNGTIRSEALLPMNLGTGRAPALLIMGSSDAVRFDASQGTDLLRFFAQAFRLALLGWLRK